MFSARFPSDVAPPDQPRRRRGRAPSIFRRLRAALGVTMLELLLFMLFASRVYQLCGHLHYLCNVPIKPGFQKTRAGHIVMTLFDGLTFTADALLISAHLLFISLALGHLAVAVLQTLAWDAYCRRFFDVLLARSFYSDGLFALRRVGLLAYDLVGQGLSFALLAAQLSARSMLPALVLGVVSYLLFTVDLAALRARRHS